MRLPGQTVWTDVLKRALTEHVGLKVLSLIAAIILFSLVRGPESAQQTVSVGIFATVPGPESSKVLVSELPEEVRLTLQGSPPLLASIRREDLQQVQIDLMNTEAPYYYFDTASFNVPAGVTIVQVTPASIPLRWAERVERRIEVNPQLSGDPPPGVSLKEPVKIEPARIAVRGAQNEIDSLAGIQTQPIDISRLGIGRHERRVALELPPPHAEYEADTVTVTLEVVPEVEERKFSSLPIEAVGSVTRIRPENVDVTLSGPPAVVSTLRGERIVPWVDAASVAPNVTAPLGVSVRGVPNNVDLVRVEPAEVLVTGAVRTLGPPP